MAGIFGGVGLEEYQFEKEDGLAYEALLFNNISYGRKYIDKFENERFIIENDSYVCMFEGFLFDIKGFNTQKDFFEGKLSFANVKKIISELDGVFSLFIYFKKEEKFFLATDHLAAVKIFYTQIDNQFIFSSDLFDITNYYKSNQKEITIDRDAIYFFLGFGSVALDKTLFKNILKLEPSTYLEYDVKTDVYEVYKYGFLDFSKNNCLTEHEIIDTYETLISKAMNRIIELNKRYGLENLAALSGGLDSKSMVVAMNQGAIDKLTTFTFAEYNSADQKIAQSVASKLGLLHNFIALDNGNCLKYNFEKSIRLSNGMVALHTILHGYNSFVNLNTKQFGILLTGQIGDAIFGSHFIGTQTLKAYIASKSHYGTVPDFLYDKIGFMDALLEEYSHNNSEAYIYEGRISNGTMYGDISLRNAIDPLTPFYSKALLNFTLTVPEKYRMDEDIYIKWLKKYHPQVLEFDWDKCACKPKSKFSVQIFKYLHTVYNAIKKRVKMKYDGMNPFDIWYRDNPSILENLDNKFNLNIEVMNFDEELKADVIKLYNSDVDRYKRNKFVVITLLLSLQLHLNKSNNV